MVEFKRKKGESFESFLRRFNKRLQQSGKLYQARQAQFLRPKKSRSEQKKSALVGRKLREKKEYLRKIGKLKEEPARRW
ncbi:MAG: 30S ribosomal protein S21 [Nitrospirota bacterium]|jgi:ribosomal protein S21|nr:30S ribosomal protein S21 [Candidatus Parcubacteria bacterium]MDP2754164.1 30S ribosomal protein S21 [Nitrospirota bacterium]MDP3043001.1 30S ribosomal protein S21 [bacterium]